MPCKTTLKIIITVLVFVVTVTASAQQSSASSGNSFTNNWQINYNLGFTQFYGDASNNGYFKKFSGEIAFATGINVRKYTSPVFGWGVNLFYSGLKSHKEKNATGGTVNFGLEGSYFDANINMLVNFSNLFWGYENRKLSVYGTIGLGYSTWGTQLTDSITGTIVSSGDVVGDITYKKGGGVVPIGLGLNYMINNNWALNFEMNLRTVLNDDVDVWRDGFKFDQPFYTGFGVSYFINPVGKPKKHKTVYQKEYSSTKNEPLKPGVPLYDYRLPKENKKKESGSEMDVLVIEVPLEVKPETLITGVVYRVQILAKRDKLKSISSLKNRFHISGEIFENYQNGIYRYSTGSFTSYKDALQHSYMLKDKGVYDAFVVAYRNGERVTITPEMKLY